MERARWVWLSGALMLFAGCGQSETPATANGAAGTSNGTPDQAVAEFLEAVRTGDDVKAGQMLTPLARQKTSEMEMMVAPPGSDTASFKVSDVEMVEGGAHVACEWTDVDADNNRHTDKIVWILRQESEGWRIAGMATKVFENELPIILNFEDPADMVRKQKMAEEEMARRAEAATAPAEAKKTAPETPVRQ